MNKLLKNTITTIGIVGSTFLAGYFLGYSNSSNRFREDFAMQAVGQIIVGVKTLEKLEVNAVESIKSDHETILRGAFLSLVNLHRTNPDYKQEDFIKRQLKRAKLFMQSHPDEFLKKRYFSLEPDGKTVEVTETQQKILQTAYEYVDSLE